MEGENFTWVVVAFIAIFLVSGGASAYHAINKLQIELERNSGSFFSKTLVWLCGKPLYFSVFIRVFRFICTLMYVISISAWSVGMENHVVVWLLASLAYVFVAWIGAGFLFRFYPLGTLKWISPILCVPYTILYPFWPIFSRCIISASRAGGMSSTYTDDVVEESLSDLCESYESSEDCSAEVKMVQNVMELRKSKVRDCMIPRNEIVQTSEETPLSELRQLFIQTGLSKILIYRKEMGAIIGYVHAYDLFSEPSPKSIGEIIRSVYMLPESIATGKLLKEMIEKKKSIAVVLDEFGSVSGMVTLEDLMEEIFGDIEDEFDVRQEELKVGENAFEISARLKIDYLNERFNLNLPESDEYDTLGGLIITTLQRIPKAGEEVEMEACLLRVSKASDIRVEKVLVRLNK